MGGSRLSPAVRRVSAGIIRALAAEGARLMIADIADGAEVADTIARAHGGNSVASAIFDVSDETSVKSLVAQTIDRFGRIDVLVDNAALYAPLHEEKCTDIESATWDRVMAVNLRGPFLMVKHVSPYMVAQGYGKIINIGSGTAFKGIPRMLHYVTSKGGIMAFTRALSRELGENGIRVNTLAPGFTLSDTVVSENPHHVETAGKLSVAGRAIRRDAHPQDLTRRSYLSCQRRKRFHHRADPRRRWRQREYLKSGSRHRRVCGVIEPPGEVIPGRGLYARGPDMPLLLDRREDESLEVGIAHHAVVPGRGETLDLAGAVRSMATMPRFTELLSLVHSKPPPWSLPTTCISFEPLP